jgi:hypothetical protein
MPGFKSGWVIYTKAVDSLYTRKVRNAGYVKPADGPMLQAKIEGER